MPQIQEIARFTHIKPHKPRMVHRFDYIDRPFMMEISKREKPKNTTRRRGG